MRHYPIVVSWRIAIRCFLIDPTFIKVIVNDFLVETAILSVDFMILSSLSCLYLAYPAEVLALIAFGVYLPKK